MSHEHGLTLLESELHDIMLKCKEVEMSAPRNDCSPEFAPMGDKPNASKSKNVQPEAPTAVAVQRVVRSASSLLKSE
jgi:hypothetical protein